MSPGNLRYLPLPIKVNKLPGQSYPALGSPSIYNSSTLFGGHPFQKTVISGPFDSAGLKCSFHFKNSSFAMPGRRQPKTVSLIAGVKHRTMSNGSLI